MAGKMILLEGYSNSKIKMEFKSWTVYFNRDEDFESIYLFFLLIQYTFFATFYSFYYFIYCFQVQFIRLSSGETCLNDYRIGENEQ